MEIKSLFTLKKPDTNVNKLGNSILHEEGLSDARSNCKLQSECGDAQQPLSAETLERSTNEDANTSDSLDFIVILKKLIDRGKVNVKDIASEIGVSPDSLASMLADDCVVPDLHCKIVTWLRNHAYVGTLQKNLKVKIKSSIASKDDTGASEDSDAIKISKSDNPDVVPVKSVPPRRKTKSNIKILKDNKVICSSKETISDDGIVMDGAKRGQFVIENTDYSTKKSVSDATEKNLMEPDGVHDTLASDLPKHEAKFKPGKSKAEAVSSSYIHPLVRNKMSELQNMLLSNNATSEYDGKILSDAHMSHLLRSCGHLLCLAGSRDRENFPMEASSSSGICCNQPIEHLNSSDMISEIGGSNLEQLVKARNMGVLEMSPEDEVEGELIFYQHRLLCNVVERKRFSDDLICEVVKSLPCDIDAVGKQKWDAVLVNQYLSELREAKKQGRKERRHMEAQALLAAATAAASSSSRISSFRKDTRNESSHQEVNLLKMNTLTGRAGLYSQHMPRVKETLPKLAVPRVSSEMNSDFVHSVSSDFSKEHSRSCDICRRNETVLNPILVCSRCKVAVHLDCYCSVKDSAGPWYCELCEDLLLSRSSEAQTVNSWEKPYFAVECGLCGGTAGAFRKSTDGQWIHAFCAEWVLASTFRRGQGNPAEGMCNFGHCQSTFHPACARSAGCYMNVKIVGGKLQHKAYCEKHSLEQRAKVETQKHGIEELKSIKQIRVELERLRLLCERIVKREKLKRELVLCFQDILVSNRDSAALSALVRSPFFPPNVSSESATTSLKNTDDCRSGSEAIQRSDDITVDSTVSGKRRIKFSFSMEHDRKTDDSSTSQHLYMEKPRERVSFSGKQIPLRPFVASQNLSDDGEKRSISRKV
ncbi:hypothetical protein HYC85_019970 [Camellia sinensis]|uniref:PHD-type domain-containing protein n=1 Tax=Camellia sinensis TaxID=4442 RepID=A0A7J7GSC8_CAMSI|nr:hypothetical protein HYC85_019970 [Camellia sinensis]